jgi:hypothetical protein
MISDFGFSILDSARTGANLPGAGSRSQMGRSKSAPLPRSAAGQSRIEIQKPQIS